MNRRTTSLRRSVATVLALGGMIFQIMLGLALPSSAVATPASAYLILCSSEETRVVAVDANGQEVPDAATHGHCDVCLIADLGSGDTSAVNRPGWSRDAAQVRFPDGLQGALAALFTGTPRTRAPPAAA